MTEKCFQKYCQKRNVQSAGYAAALTAMIYGKHRIFTNACKQDIAGIYPKQEFIKKENHFLFKMDKEQNADLYYCPMLDNEKGCILGDDKPFDCRIWPLRVMALNETKVITLSPVCPTMNEKSIKELTKTANELADQIFEYADENRKP